MTASRWNGSSYTALATAKRWDGSAWVDIGRGRRWSGSAWVDVLPRVNIADKVLSDAATDGFISYELLSSGTAQRTSGTLGTLAFTGEWLVRGAASDFQVRATLNSGALDAGSSATGAWLALTSARTWLLDFDGSAELTIEIRDAASLDVLDSATVSLSVGGI